ncbi:RNA polymerase subunit RPABC4/transcription elongation factor Spt4 [Polynucleobacter sphagniphilus]|jgi:RNA polymerase subunit RPABC4/transcription elongation factor Spt4|uniref:RNA polymerase subunit RPABC4/transcription elongation factor Spt4 n=1 Tax=Polynucleobacter sphagniphilus TaxID=1743169 RepID=A0AA43S643_9BURK|nr:RNA polymerase subunit RPABC4/transcription elongation factor Spt4 [Polynucleobacter sphagniphilus]MDH6513604.1 RNA polymerase subunit RPABC4/transcription elongation factor Spt4 [Polynucleobacter sphagniphilus]
MGSRYRFVCPSCKFDCICSIGRERTGSYLSVPMICRQCKDVAEYKVTDPLSLSSSYLGDLSCRVCHSSEYLDEWDGITCPQCQKPMRAIGADVDAKKSDEDFGFGRRGRL